jgi:hypothetical protein
VALDILAGHHHLSLPLRQHPVATESGA